MKKSTSPIFIRKTDFIIFGIITALAVFCLVFVKSQTEKGSFAEITVGGKVLANVSLENDEIFRINGIDNVEFEVKDGAICVKSNDCADKICEKTGFVSNCGESIVCLPKKLTVTVKSKFRSDDFDAAVG